MLEDDGVDRGLVFVCFQADIWRQFETIQALWIDDGDPFGLGADKDFLIGEPHGTDGKMTIPGHPPFFLKPQPRFVTMRGGEYLFQPSMSGTSGIGRRVSLLATSLVTTAASLSAFMDGDAQGHATLAWDGWRGDHQVVRTVDLRDGKPAGAVSELRRVPASGSLELSDFDVAASGAAVACLRDRRSDNQQTWRVRIARRMPGGTWSRPIFVAAPNLWVERISCAIADTGQVTLAWVGFGRRVRTTIYATSVSADGRAEPPVRLARDAVDEPETVVAPDGSATISFTEEQGKDRMLYLSQRPAGGGWTTRAIATAFSPQITIDGAGRPIVGWFRPDDRLDYATGPDFTPAPLPSNGTTFLDGMVAGPRGDVLATFETRPWTTARGDERLSVSLQRPGEPFGAPIVLGSLAPHLPSASLAADGSGAIAWVAGTERRPRPVLRRLGTDGRWAGPETVRGYDNLLIAAPGGRVTVAWAEQGSDHDTLRVALYG